MTVMPPTILAVFCVSTQLTLIAAATPTPPPSLPVSELEVELPSEVPELAVGSVPVPVFLVLSLPLTCLFAFVSASSSFLLPSSSSSSLAPEALAWAFVALFMVVCAITETVVPLMLRDTARTATMVAHLRRSGILATGLNYPVVPKGDEEIRFQISADHTAGDIDSALEAVGRFNG